MPRIPYPEDQELDDESRARLAALPPLNVMRMMAGAPSSFAPLVDLGSSILLASELDPRLREIAILTVGRVTGSGYEVAQHVELSRAIGMDEAEIQAAVAGEAAGLADDDARLVARAAHEITRDVRACDEVVAALLERFGRRVATEVVVCVAYYNAVARILETTGVELEDELPWAAVRERYLDEQG